MDRSASARNTVEAFYPEVFWGVIYISAGKVAVKGIYTQVVELILIGYSIA